MEEQVAEPLSGLPSLLHGNLSIGDTDVYRFFVEPPHPSYPYRRELSLLRILADSYFMKLEIFGHFSRSHYLRHYYIASYM
jgi:hypothetical protein